VCCQYRGYIDINIAVSTLIKSLSLYPVFTIFVSARTNKRHHHLKQLNFDSISLWPAFTYDGLVKGGERITASSMCELQHGTTSSFKLCINCDGHDTLHLCLMFGKIHESNSVKMKFGRLLLAEKQRTALASGETNTITPNLLHAGCDARFMAGIEPMDFLSRIISCMSWFNLDNV
jgi:hypothetical protein